MTYDFNDQEFDRLVRVVAAEAGNQGAVGQVAVLHVIKTRAEKGDFGGHTVDGVLKAKNQFEPMWTEAGRANMRNVSDERYNQIANLARGVFSGQIADPTGGATHFANVDTVKQRRNGGVTDWMEDMKNTSVKIKDHTFYGGDRNKAAAAQKELQVEGTEGAYAMLDKWERVLKSSPEHVRKELEALGEDEEAKKLLEEWDKHPQEQEMLDKAASLVQKKAKDRMRSLGADTGGRNLTVADMLGGTTAAAVVNPENADKKMGELVTDEKLLAATGKLLGKENIADMPAKDFLQAIDEQQKLDKKALADSAGDNLSPQNKDFLSKLMENPDIGIVEFIFMFIMLLMMNSAGLSMDGSSQQQNAPSQPGKQGMWKAPVDAPTQQTMNTE